MGRAFWTALGGSRPTLWALICLLAHAALAVSCLRQQSVTADEFAHLPAGVCYWRTGSFFAYPVNPPLVKLLAALPVLAARPDVEFVREFPPDETRLLSTAIGQRFFETNRNRYYQLFFLARYVSVSLSVLGGWFTFCWARDLFGPPAGCTAVALWAFGPNILAHAGLVTMDMGAAAIAMTASYWYWRWLKKPNWSGALGVGVLLGLAELTKFTLLVLYPTWTVLWLAWRLRAWRDKRSDANRTPANACPAASFFEQLVTIFVISLFVINAGYCFEGTCRPLGEYHFVSRGLSTRHIRATPLHRDQRGVWVSRYQTVDENRFRGTWLARLPVPLPAFYLIGLDHQEHDFDPDTATLSYLRGCLRHGGWWYYYLYALLIKLPIGTLMLFGLAVGFAIVNPCFRAPCCDEVALALPAIGVMALVSVHTGFTVHMRYALPVVPFVFVWLSRVSRLLVRPPRPLVPSASAKDTRPGSAFESACADLFGKKGRGPLWYGFGAVVALCVLWNAVGVLRIHPHYLSYFNELVGGPDYGARHLIDSNIDWGQDLLFFKRWLKAHPEAKPMSMAYFSSIDASVAGLELPLPPCGPTAGMNLDSPLADRLGPLPGWYAISVTRLFGEPGNGFPLGAYAYFRRFQPVAKAGYSIYIYHISASQANVVRRQLGLRVLPQ